jgi:hypothetical protein
MVHTVPIGEFCAVVVRELGTKSASITRIGSQIIVTAANTESRLIVRSVTEGKLGTIREDLEKQGLTVEEGMWTLEEESVISTFGPLIYVSAVSYLANPTKPGIWVDAFPEPVTPLQAIRAMFDELCADGEVRNLTFEEFMEMARPHAVVVTPAELEDFLRQKVLS